MHGGQREPMCAPVAGAANSPTRTEMGRYHQQWAHRRASTATEGNNVELIRDFELFWRLLSGKMAFAVIFYIFFLDSFPKVRYT